MDYVMHLTVDDLGKLIEKTVSTRILPLEKALQYLTERADEDLLKIEEVAAKLQVTDRTIRNWVNAKKIKCYWIGDRQYFMMKDIIACMKSNF